MLDTGEFKSVPVDLLLSHLPTWLLVNTSDAPSGTGYHKIMEPIANSLAEAIRLFGLVDDGAFLHVRSQTYPRTIWRCDCNGINVSTITLQVSGDASPTTLREVRSQGALLCARDPVYCLSSDGFIYMRNLAQVEEQVTSLDGDYALSGGNLISDENIYIYTGSEWEPVSPDPEVVDYTIDTLTLGTSGTVALRYSTRQRLSLLESNCVSVNSGPTITPTVHDIWNIYDEIGMLASLDRIPGETNDALGLRIKTAFVLPGRNVLETTRSQIGHELGLVGLLSWDGTTTLDLAGLGLENVSYITVVELPKTRTVSELLSPDPDGRTFVSSSALWSEGRVYLNGTRVTEKSFPGMVVENGIVDFSTQVVGTVSAVYTCQLYTTVVDKSTNTATLSPTLNTVEGSYTVLYVKDIETTNVLSPSNIENLLGQNGLPTEQYTSASAAAAAASPVLLGSTEWGSKSYWFDDTEIAPTISHLPVLLR